MSRASMNARSSSSIVVADEPLLDPVGEPARVETVLEAPAAVVIEAHAEIMRRHAPEIHVAAIGDSITAGSPWDDDPSIGWPAAAAEADPRLHFTVRAVYGKRTDEIAAWLDEAAAGAEVLVVQGGINDIAQGRAVADAAANLANDDPARARSSACASPSRTSSPGTTAGRAPRLPSAS